MPTPDWEEPLNSFLKSIMIARYGSAEGKLGQQRLAMEQQRLNAEQANHAADMQQRASQFGQEMEYRKNQALAEQAFRDKTLAQGEAARQDASQERFRAAGGQLFATPTDKTFNLGVNPLQAPNPADILMPRAATQPVGPQMNQETASMSNPAVNLPMPQQPQIPIQMTIPAEAQLPDPERYQKTVPPLGTPAGQEAYFPTLKGKTLEAKEAADEANQITVTPAMERSFSDLGLKAGDKIDRNMIPIMENAASRALTRQQTASQFQANQITKQNEMDLKQFLAEMALDRKGAGKSVPDKQAKANYDAVMGATDPAEAYKSLAPPEKSRFRQDAEDAGHGIPSSISSQSKTQETAARNSKGMIDQFEKTLKDPDINRNIGPIMGNVAALAQGKIGTTLSYTDPLTGRPATPQRNAEINQKVQTFRSALTYMLFSEGKQLMPGRISSQLIDLLKETSPNPRQALPLLEGSLAAVKNNANEYLTSAEKERFNGRVRPGFIESLYPERTKADGLPESTKKSIGPGMSVNVGGHKIYHDPDDNNFYEIP